MGRLFLGKRASLHTKMTLAGSIVNRICHSERIEESSLDKTMESSTESEVLRRGIDIENIMPWWVVSKPKSKNPLTILGML